MFLSMVAAIFDIFTPHLSRTANTKALANLLRLENMKYLEFTCYYRYTVLLDIE